MDCKPCAADINSGAIGAYWCKCNESRNFQLNITNSSTTTVTLKVLLILMVVRWYCNWCKCSSSRNFHNLNITSSTTNIKRTLLLLILMVPLICHGTQCLHRITDNININGHNIFIWC